ncbi:MAG: FAD-binding protein [Chloroflexi bacterium]|nr:FAD-binding protein [Chloroflexota bacterium]
MNETAPGGRNGRQARPFGLPSSASPVEPVALATDVLVVGGGVAALRAAIAAREAGAEVVVCCKSLSGRSGNTVVSTADISAYVPEYGVDDSEEIFASDTISSGASIADERLVGILVERSGSALLDLERLGVPLLRAGDRIDRTRAAGHSRARTYRADPRGAGPNKGLALSIPLADRARRLGVPFLDRTPIVRITVEDAHVAGGLFVDLSSDVLLSISAGAVIIAAGGASHLFARTNGTGDATGDAIALAMRAGALARDLEFVQWHPTRMDEPVSLFLTNSLLADGAVLRDADGRAFMDAYDPRSNLAPRDILAKAVYREARSGRGVNGGVYLDCSAVGDDRIELRHAYLAETLRRHGVDFPRQWLVVSPATHFLMGGLVIDEHAASPLPGLFVVGESAGGVHGANRLGGNAFCEGLVFGTIAGQAAARFASANAPSPYVPDPISVSPRAPDPQPTVLSIWKRLRQTMWQDASLVRDAHGLARAAAAVEELAQEALTLGGRRIGEIARILELRASLDCARAILAAAAFRQESRGAHWRADFPEESAAWHGHVSVAWDVCSSQPSLQFYPKNPTA